MSGPAAYNGWETAPRPARGRDLSLLDLPPDLPPDWRERFLAGLERALKRYRCLRLFVQTCQRCGACQGACPFEVASGEAANLPAARLALVADLLARLPRLRTHPQELEPQVLMTWYARFYQCSLCRRCAVFCPLGLDMSLVTLACREVLASVGLVGEAVAKATANFYRAGNSLGVGRLSWSSACQALEQRLARNCGRPVLCPVDEYGAQVLLVPPVADLTEHWRTFQGYAKLFHAAGVSWTTSTHLCDGANPGGFIDYRNLRLIHQRVLEAARELKPSLIMWGESGHGWALARTLPASLGLSWSREDYLEVPRPVHIYEWAAGLLKSGAFAGRLHKEVNAGKVVLWHDPCHLARSAGLLAQPRALLRAACHFVREMPASAWGPRTWCCGGGGGLAGGELTDMRRAAFLPLAAALEEAQREQRCNWLATGCDGCKTNLGTALRHHGLNLGHGGVLELLGEALLPDRAPGVGEAGA